MSFDYGNLVRNIAVSVALTALGAGAHQVVESASQERTLAAHSEQIAKLSDEVEKVDVGIARIEGKIDVLNQKIDDDRTRSASDQRH